MKIHYSSVVYLPEGGEVDDLGAALTVEAVLADTAQFLIASVKSRIEETMKPKLHRKVCNT